jgi:hypothetical protein
MIYNYRNIVLLYTNFNFHTYLVEDGVSNRRRLILVEDGLLEDGEEES